MSANQQNNPILRDQVTDIFTAILARRPEQQKVERDNPLKKDDVKLTSNIVASTQTVTAPDPSSFTYSNSAPVAGFTRTITSTETYYTWDNLKAVAPEIADRCWREEKSCGKEKSLRANLVFGNAQQVDAHNLDTQRYSAWLNTSVRNMESLVQTLITKNPQLKREEIVTSLTQIATVLRQRPDSLQASNTDFYNELSTLLRKAGWQNEASQGIIAALKAPPYEGTGILSTLASGPIKIEELKAILGTPEASLAFSQVTQFVANYNDELIKGIGIEKQTAKVDVGTFRSYRYYSWEYPSSRLITPGYINAVLTGRTQGYDRTPLNEQTRQALQTTFNNNNADANLQLIQSIYTFKQQTSRETFSSFSLDDIKALRTYFEADTYKPEMMAKFGVTETEFNTFKKDQKGQRLFSTMQLEFETNFIASGKFPDKEKRFDTNPMATYQNSPTIKTNIQLMERMAQPNYTPSMTDFAVLLNISLTEFNYKSYPTDKESPFNTNGYSFEDLTKVFTAENLKQDTPEVQRLVKLGISKEALIKFAEFKMPDGSTQNLFQQFLGFYQDPEKFKAAFSAPEKAPERTYGIERLKVIQTLLNVPVHGGTPDPKIQKLSGEHFPIMFQPKDNPNFVYATQLAKLGIHSPEKGKTLALGLSELSSQTSHPDFQNKAQAWITQNKVNITADELKSILTFTPQGWDSTKLGNFSLRLMGNEATITKMGQLNQTTLVQFFNDRQTADKQINEASAYNQLIASIDPKQAFYSGETLFVRFFEEAKIKSLQADMNDSDKKSAIQDTKAVAELLHNLVINRNKPTEFAQAAEKLRTTRGVTLSNEELTRLIEFCPNNMRLNTYKDGKTVEGPLMKGAFIETMIEFLSATKAEDPHSSKAPYTPWGSRYSSSYLEIYAREFGKPGQTVLNGEFAKKFLAGSAGNYTKYDLIKYDLEVGRVERYNTNTDSSAINANTDPFNPPLDLTYIARGSLPIAVRDQYLTTSSSSNTSNPSPVNSPTTTEQKGYDLSIYSSASTPKKGYDLSIYSSTPKKYTFDPSLYTFTGVNQSNNPLRTGLQSLSNPYSSSSNNYFQSSSSYYSFSGSNYNTSFHFSSKALC